MRVENVLEIISEFNNTDINYLEYKSNGTRIIMKKSIEDEGIKLRNIAMEEVAGTLCGKEECIDVTSKYVCLIDTVNSSNNEPFVKINESVKKGDRLGIIKYLNVEIDLISPIDGIIQEICIDNNQLIEYGQELFKIKKDHILGK